MLPSPPQDLTKSTSEAPSKEDSKCFKEPLASHPTTENNQTTDANNPLGEMNILHLENDALLDFLGEGDDDDLRPSQTDSNQPPLMHQSFDLISNLGGGPSVAPTTSAAAVSTTSSTSTQRCSSISPSTIGNRPAGMVRPTVRVAPRTENHENSHSNNINNNNINNYAGCDTGNNNSFNNQNQQQNLNSSLEGHSFDDSFNFVTQQQVHHSVDNYSQPLNHQNKRLDGAPSHYGGPSQQQQQHIYGRSITAPSPIPSHVYNGHRKHGVSPSPSPASFISGVSGVSGPSPSPLTINGINHDRAINYNPSASGFYEEDSVNNTGFSDQSDFSQNYGHHYGGGHGNTMVPNQNAGGNHTFAPIQPGGESNVSLMNNQLELLGIKSGDTFNMSNNYGGGGGGGAPHEMMSAAKEPQSSTLLKSYLTDQTNPNICKPTATTTTTTTIKNEERNVQLVAPQHLPASEFLRHAAKLSSRTPKDGKPNNDYYSGWNGPSDGDKKAPSLQAPTPPSSFTASPPDQRLEQEIISAMCSKNPLNNYDVCSKESPLSDRPVLTPDTDSQPLTPLGGEDCLGVHQLGDNLLEELQGFS